VPGGAWWSGGSGRARALNVFAALDQAKLELGIETYTLSQTTLEQVFLNISAKQLDED